MAARDPRYTDRSTERSLLGGMLIDNNRFVLTAGKVGYSDFSERLHGEIFYCIGEIVQAGKVATPVTLKACMQQETFDNLIYPEAGDVTIGSYLANLAAEADNSDPISLAVRIRQLTALNTIVQLTKSFEGHQVDDILQAANCLAFDADFIATAMRGGNTTTSEPLREQDQL
jgi:replicative DNA helicase